MRFWHSPAFRWGALIGGALAWRLILFVGAQGSDDLAYSEAAWTISCGAFPANQGIHGARIGYVGIIGALYALFGAGTFSLVCFNLASSLAEVGLTRLVAREYLDDAGAWLAAALVAILPVHVFHATEAHPDVPTAALTTLSVLLFLRALKTDSVRGFLVSGAALGAAHWMKESAFMGLAALALLGGRPRPRALWAVAGFAGMVVLESCLFWAATGDPGYRIRTVRAMQGEIMNAGFYLQSAPTLRRLLLDVPLMFFWVGEGSFVHFALAPTLALVGAVWAWKRGDATLRGPILWAVSLLLLLTFWPIRLVPYRPAMVAFPRIFLVAAVPMAILAASALRRLPARGWAPVFGIVVAAGLAGALVLHSDGRRESAGARLAHPLTQDRPVVSDPRTIQFFRLYDGYFHHRSLVSWKSPTPAEPHYRVVNGVWIRNLRTWSGLHPPEGFGAPGVSPFRTEVIPGRIRLRSLLRGRVERVGTEELRIYRVP